MKNRRKLDKSWTKSDFTVNWFSGTGAGDQHRNKHQNCVRLTHIESGVMVTAQSHKERQRNMAEALNKMAQLLVEWQYGDEAKMRNPVTDVVRTYNEAENHVHDHRTGLKTTHDSFELDDVLAETLAKKSG